MAVLNFFGTPVAVSATATYMYKAASLVNGVAIGTAANESFLVGNGAYTLSGGAGDDYYYQVSSQTNIIEAAGGGVDTLASITSLTMPENVENLVIGSGSSFIGNTLGNYMVGTAATQSIDGGVGNDVFTGGGGGDSYVFTANSGYDLITDFHAGTRASGPIDTVRLTGYTQFDSFAKVQAALTQSGSDVVLKLDGSDSIKFANTTLSAITSDNILLANSPKGLALAFGDEFNMIDSSGGSTSSTKWRSDYGFGGDASLGSRTFVTNGSKQIMVDPTMKGFGAYSDQTVSINPFSVNNGVLTIHAAPTPAQYVNALAGYQFTSGAITTRDSFTQTYGYFEAKLELPAGGGAWPAFWLYAADGSKAEIDIMESHSGSEWTTATHDYTTGTDVKTGSTIYTPDLSTGFHTYGVLWSAAMITWYLDGVAVRTADTPASMHGPMYMILDLELDSSTTSAFTGADMKVDYVHAYSLDNLPASVTGSGGNDTLTDGGGARTLTGGVGNDAYYVSSAATAIVETTTGGVDTVNASVNYTLGANVEHLVLTGAATTGTGNALDNHLTGNLLKNILSGGAGNDVIDGGAGADNMFGGIGNDAYYVDNAGDRAVENVAEGYDTVYTSINYTAAANIEQVTLTGTARQASSNDAGTLLQGNALGDILTGGRGIDAIIGGAGDDRIEGGAGWDKLTGGTGNDVFVVRAGFNADVITDFDLAHDRIDWSALAAYYTKGPIITESSAGDAVATFGKDAITFSGVRAAALIAAQVFVSPAAIAASIVPVFNKIVGVGTIGNDQFTVTSATDTIDNTTVGGKDSVMAYVDYALPANITTIVLGGTATHAVGNDLNNSFFVTTALDTFLMGGAGNDSFVSGKGADSMYGGTGNDYFVVNHIGDKVIEYANEGIDFVSASVNYALPDNVEKLALEGNAITATGNALDNTLVGNDKANWIYGGAGNDYVDGGAGADHLIGGTGDDTYLIDNVGDVIVEQAGEGNDYVAASVDYKAPENVDALQIKGTATHATGNDGGMTLYGNTIGSWLVGGRGDDFIVGGIGNDVITGGAGNDRLIGHGGSDTFVFAPGFGHDTIIDFNVRDDHVDWSAVLRQPGIEAIVTEVGWNTTFTFGTDSVTFQGVHAADLSAYSFL